VWPTASPAAPAPDTSSEQAGGPWSSTWPAEPAADASADQGASLWPSTWPADQPQGDAPAWAATPAPEGDHSDADSRGFDQARAQGGDGGSIGEVAGLALGNGDHDAAPPAGFGAIQRPPELDELPSWYTDPLPNHPAGGGLSDPRAFADPFDGRGSDGWGEPPNGGHAPQGGSSIPNGGAGNGGHAADPGSATAGRDGNGAGGRDSADPWGQASAAASAPGGYRLPGAGDELRSLFGEVVSGEPGTEAPPRGPAGELPSPPRGDLHGTDDDPLGPPQARPPIDLSQLDRPLGPMPYLPNRPAAAETAAPAPGRTDDATPPARLPRRGEAQTWTPPSARQQPDAPARLPRAGEQPATPRTPRPGPRQVAPAPDQRSETRVGAASAGPPALPVIILVAVVAILALGVAWLVVTGDDGGTPASDRATGSGAEEGTPSDVQATEVAEGIQVTWSGSDDASYVVTVLTPTAPPDALPATIGTSALVPNVEGAASAPRCFTVAQADDTGAPTGAASDPACLPGASIGDMQQAGG
jgi:hypothetical protein